MVIMGATSVAEWTMVGVVVATLALFTAFGAVMLGREGKRFDRIDQRFDRIDQRFDRVDQRFDRVDQRFDRVDQRFDRVDREMAEFKAGVLLETAELKAGVLNLATRMDGLEREMAGIHHEQVSQRELLSRHLEAHAQA